jgi:hypothetical protein
MSTTLERAAKEVKAGKLNHNKHLELIIAARNIEIHALKAKLRKEMRFFKSFEEALRWYADSTNWKRTPDSKNVFGNRKWQKPWAAIDRGARANFLINQFDAAGGPLTKEK